MKTVLDVETTWVIKNDDRNPSPYLPGNKLVSVGVACYNDDNSFIGQRYFFFNHADLNNDELVRENTARLKAILAKTTLLICHHVKFDLSWIRECGFKYDGDVYCTMIAEYMLQRGVKTSLALEDLCNRYGLAQKRVDLIQPYYDKGIHFYDIPMGITETYGLGDINSTWELYLAQCTQYLRPANRGLIKIRDWMFRFCKALTQLERAGIKVDLVELAKIKKEYTEEYNRIEKRLHEIVYEVHGDKKINFNSPEQLSEFIYGVKVIDKERWAERFGIKVVKRGAVSKRARPKLKESTLKRTIEELTTPVLKTRAVACPSCGGKGLVNQVLSSGKVGNRLIKCKTCFNEKIIYETDGETGSLGLIFLAEVSQATSGGFKTDKSLIEKAKLDLDRKKYAIAWEFLELIHKLNQISTYLDTFIGGIERNVGADEILHPEFMQCVTATGRLSSRNPNFQNQPRGGTFPVRRCIVSRFNGGHIAEADYKALEYRCAVSLARDEAGKNDICAGVDAHTVTAKSIGCNRQDAKPHCVPMSSEILTRAGWKTYETVIVGEDVLTYNADKKINEWQPLLDKTKFENQEIIELANKHWKIQCTPNHKWFARKRNFKIKDRFNATVYEDKLIEAQNLNTECQIITSAVANTRSSIDLSNDEVRLLGWIWSDGTIRFSNTGRPRALIIQSSKNRSLPILEELIKGICINKVFKDDGVTYVYTLNPEIIKAIYVRANLDFYKPDYISFVLALSSEQRNAWLHAVVLCEGTIRPKGNVIRISQNSGSKAEAIKLAAYMNGYDIRVTYVPLYTGKINEQITLRKRAHVTCQRIVKTKRENGDVWCPQTINKSWVMRQGKHITITGNSFKPLYGGSTGSEKEQQYYEFFLTKHSGIAKWHEQLQNEAIHDKRIKLPTGREYAFPLAKRLFHGGSTFATQIKNYPVQGFATGDIVPIACVIVVEEIARRKLRSVVINEVHDNLLVDTYPGEEETILRLLKRQMEGVSEILLAEWGYDMWVPLTVELKIGKNNLDMQEVML